jgi:hypothetical protein
MALLDRIPTFQAAGRASPPRGKELMAGILLAVLLATLAIRNVVPADALAPIIVTVLFAIGAAMAALALLCRAGQFRASWFELAGSLTFIGVVISVLIDPDQLIRLCGASDQSD